MDSIEYSRVAGALRKLNNRDRQLVSHLKENETKAEEIVWKMLRDDKIAGIHFRRQHKIGKFVVDFFCFKCRLAIEVDGKIHLGRIREDAARTRWLELQGIRVVRFSNDLVFDKRDDVRAEIKKVILEQQARFNT